MQMEAVFGQSLEPGQAHVCQAPEAFDALSGMFMPGRQRIDMHPPTHEFILGMIHAKVPVSQVHQPVIAAPFVRINHRD